MKKYIIFIILLAAINLNASDQFSDDFLNKDKYGWSNFDKYVKAREIKFAKQELLQMYDLEKQNTINNILKSTVAPGWGQFSTKRYLKGQLLVGAEIALIGSFLYYNDKYLTNYDEYKKANYIGDIEKFYDKANKYHLTSRTFLALGITVWLYNIFDAAISTNNYNQDIWDSLYNDYERGKIILSPNGISLRF